MKRTRSLKRKLLRAKIALNQTLHNILQINRTRKKLPYFDNYLKKEAALEEELKVLNKIAAQKAKLIRKYEDSLEGPS